MKKCIQISAFILCLSALAWAGSTKFTSAWKNPAVGPLDPAGVRIAIFVVSQDESMRLGPEETLATELRNRGRDAKAGYTVLPAELNRDKEKAKMFLKKAGLTHAIMIRVVSKDEEVNYVPGTVWYTQSYYPSFWGYWGHGWSTVYSPGYVYSDTVVTLETLLYSIEPDQLMWASISRTTNPKDIRKMVKDLANATAKQMRKAGLLQK